MTDPITVIIPTFNRVEILVKTLFLLDAHLRYEGDLFFLIGNDGDEPIYVDDENYKFINVLPGPKKGLGANLNMLLREAKTDVVLQMDDDHHLLKSLDINQFVKDLRTPGLRIDWIRLFLGTEEDLNNDDPFYDFNARMEGRYWIPVSGMHELYLPSNRAHIKRRDFHRYYGLYKEDLKLGETEAEFCHRYADVQAKRWSSAKQPQRVAIPVAAPSFDTWDHVGDSLQRQGY